MPKIIRTERYYRALPLGTIDEEARTVEVRFSSEFPVRRFMDGVEGMEILDHSPESVDLGRLNDGGAVLMDHDVSDHVGVVEISRIDLDRVGRALIRFGKSVRASEVFTDIVDRIRRTVSVGYQIIRMQPEETDDGIVFRVLRWMPFEITMTAVPADPTAQVGRSAPILEFNTEVIVMTPEEERAAQAAKDAATRAAADAETARVAALAVMPTNAEISTAIADAQRLEKARMRDISEACKRYKTPDLEEKAIAGDWPIAQLHDEILKVLGTRESEKPPTHLGMSDSDVQSYSLMRALNAAYNNNWKNAGLEKEASDRIEEELDRPARGFYIPWDIQVRQLALSEADMQRVMVVGTDAAGGFLRPTDHLAGSFIELLRAKTLLGQLGATFLPGLVGDVEIPRLDTGVTFFWVGEDVDGTLSDAVLGQVALSPKTVTGQVPISRKLLKQSAPSVEQLLLNDLARGAASIIDLAGFEGTGASAQPLGIFNQTGIGTVTIALWATTAVPDFDEVVEFETDVAGANADVGRLAYVTTAPIRGGLYTTPKDAGSGIFLAEKGMMHGYPLHVKTNLTAKTTLFGNYEDALIGMWGVLDVEPDKAAKAAAGGLVLRVFQDVDVGIRHAGSFSKGVV